jgi:hypothetical protein
MHAKFLIETNKSEGTFRLGFDLKVSFGLFLGLFGM